MEVKDEGGIVYPNTALMNCSLAEVLALLGTKSSCKCMVQTGQRNLMQKECTAKSTSVIQRLLSAGNRWVNVDSSSIRLGVAERGATPAKPLRIAPIIVRP